MVTESEAEKEICQKIYETFCSEGFDKVGSFVLANRRDAEVSWQLRFGARQDRNAEKVWISLLAGIRFESIANLLDRDDEGGMAPLFSVPIHFLHADRSFVEWDFDCVETQAKIICEIREYALPFFLEYGIKDNLVKALRDDDPQKWFSVSRNARIEILAALLASIGKNTEALNYLEFEIKARMSKPPGHRIALERLRERINSQ